MHYRGCLLRDICYKSRGAGPRRYSIPLYPKPQCLSVWSQISGPLVSIGNLTRRHNHGPGTTIHCLDCSDFHNKVIHARRNGLQRYLAKSRTMLAIIRSLKRFLMWTSDCLIQEDTIQWSVWWISWPMCLWTIRMPKDVITEWNDIWCQQRVRNRGTDNALGRWSGYEANTISFAAPSWNMPKNA